MDQNVNDIAVTVGVTDTPIVGANGTRKLLLLVNAGATTIFVKFRGSPNYTAAALNTGIALAPGATMVLDNNGMWYGAISGISSAPCIIVGQETYE